MLEQSFEQHIAELEKENEQLKEKIAKQERTMSLLRKSSKLFYSFMRYIPALAFLKDHEGRYVYLNEACKKILKKAPEDILGKTDDEIFPIDIAHQIKMHDRLVISQVKTLNTIEKFLIEGEQRYQLTSKFPILKQGKPYLVAGVSFDITDKIQAENALNALNEKREGIELAQLIHHHRLPDASHPEFIVNVSKMIRFCRNTIASACDLIHNSESFYKRKEYLDIINSHGHILNGIANDLKDLSHISNCPKTLNHLIFSLEEFTGEIIDSLLETIQQKGMTIRLDIDDDVPAYLIGDPFRLRQILVNILSYMIESSNTHAVILAVKTISRHESDKTVKLAFSLSDRSVDKYDDTYACLVDFLIQDRIGEVEGYYGEGLGLSVCKHALKTLGSEFRIEDHPDDGVSFTFSFPAEYASIDSHPHKVIHRMTDQIRTLLIESEAICQTIIVNTLEKNGDYIRVAATEKEAFTEIENDIFDIVIINTGFIHQSNSDIIKALHQKSRRKELLFIGLSDFSLSCDRQIALEKGVFHLISKPITQKKLISELKAALPGLFNPTETPASNECFIDASVDFPVLPDQLPGLDIEEGIRRFAGSWNLYNDMLKFFCEEKRPFVEKFKTLIDQKDYKAASILAHALKGSAGTIAALELAIAAKELEHACDRRNEKRILALIPSVEEALHQVFTSYESIKPFKNVDNSPEIETQDVDIAQIGDYIKELDSSLLSFDPVESEYVFKKIKTIAVGSISDEHINESIQTLEDQIGNYNFDDARRTLRHITRNLFESDDS